MKMMLLFFHLLRTQHITIITLHFSNITSQKFIFVNYIYTSPYTMTLLHTIDHSRITGYLRSYDPKKQYYCLLPYNDASRPIMFLQKYLIHFDDFLYLAMFVLSSLNLSLSSNTLFPHLSMTRKSLIIQLCQSKLIPAMIFSSFLLTSSLSWLKPKQLDLKHSIPLLNNTLLNGQKSPLTNLTNFLHHVRFVISFTNLIYTNKILRILHSPHSHIISIVTTILSR